VSLFRRREPLHERLAREGGLQAPPLQEPRPPGWMETGIHGVHRQREWDAVVAVEAEGVQGDAVHFVALPDDTLLFPGHNYGGPSSTIGDEKRHNPFMRFASLGEFLRVMGGNRVTLS